MMPLIDKPLAELKSYMGSTPRPADFDAYWDRALAELDATDLRPEFRPGPELCPAVECYDLTFTAVDGARVHVRHTRPRGLAGPAPTILEFHGYSMRAHDWCDALKYTAMGFSHFGLDVRGQGGESHDLGGQRGWTLRGHFVRGLDDEPDRLWFRNVYLDCAAMARIAAQQSFVDPNRMGSVGWSQGGALSLVCAALHPSLARCVSVYPFLSDYQRVWEMDLARDAYDELREYFRRFDPRHEREREVFERLGYIDVQNLAPRIRAKVLMGTGLMDTICPPSTQFAAYNKIVSEKEMTIYPDFGHEGLPEFGDQIVRFLGQL